MNKKFLIGVALASFSLSSIAQVTTRVIGGVTIQTPNGQGGTFSPQPGITIQSANSMTDSNTSNAAINNNIDSSSGIDMSSSANSGIGNGAPDLAEFQAQSIAAAQALKESSVDLNKPVNLQMAPEGAAEILKNGPNVLQTNDTKQLGVLSKEAVPNNFSQANANQVTFVIKNNKPKSDLIVTDISAWNKTSIDKFEQEGKARTEARYKEFLLTK
jgi:hypothetical protein